MASAGTASSKIICGSALAFGRIQTRDDLFHFCFARRHAPTTCSFHNLLAKSLVDFVSYRTMCKPKTNGRATLLATKGNNNANKELAKADEWLVEFDYDSFNAELKTLGKSLESEQGPSDVQHLNKMITWGNSLAVCGLLSMGFSVNILSIACISTFVFARWTMIAHHTCHGGYENCHPERKGRWSRFKFALGTLWRRFFDWFDWMMPEAWNVEHNNRHHYNLSEIHDPDLVEQNLADLRTREWPVALKYVQVFFAAAVWKWYYYAPNTYKELKLAQWRREGKKIPDAVKPEMPIVIDSILFGQNPFYSAFEFFSVVLGPYLLFHFILTPLPWLLVGNYVDGYTGRQMYLNAVTNMFLADILTNLHGFLCVVTNHAGDDMYRFNSPCRPFSGSFCLRQILASVDYDYGSDLVDFMHGYLNYQIEHHLWPNLSMRSYQKAAPQVRAICEKYGVPYVKHNVFYRLKKTVDIMVGNTSMREFPEHYEKAFLEMDAEKETMKDKRK